jgi:hypothetical protein
MTEYGRIVSRNVRLAFKPIGLFLNKMAGIVEPGALTLIKAILCEFVNGILKKIHVNFQIIIDLIFIWVYTTNQ